MLFNYNTSEPSDVLFDGEPYPFNGTPTIVGDAITQTSEDSFTISETGTYRVEFTIVQMGFNGEIEISVNGVAIPPVIPSAPNPFVPIVGDATFTASAGDVVQLSLSGTTMSLFPGDNATITITQVDDSPPV